MDPQRVADISAHVSLFLHPTDDKNGEGGGLWVEHVLCCNGGFWGSLGWLLSRADPLPLEV